MKYHLYLCLLPLLTISNVFAVNGNEQAAAAVELSVVIEEPVSVASTSKIDEAVDKVIDAEESADVASADADAAHEIANKAKEKADKIRSAAQSIDATEEDQALADKANNEVIDAKKVAKVADDAVEDANKILKDAEEAVAAAEVEAWTPSETEFDWIRLSSDEWLKGEIKSMYDESLEFDSAELDLLTIDLDDVKYLQSFKTALINIEGQGSIRGRLNISEDVVSIGEGADVKIFSRGELVSFTPGGTHEIDLWSIKFTLGVDVNRGNTNQFDFTSKLVAKRRTAKSRLDVDYIGNISRTDGVSGQTEESLNNHRFNTSINNYVTRSFFYTPMFFEYYTDNFQNIEARYSLGIGLGYTIVDSKKVDWTVSAGPSYLSTQYVSVQAGNELKVDAASFALGTVYDTEINGAVDFVFKYDIQLAKDESGGYSHNMGTTLETELTSKLDFDVSAYWNHVSKPVPNENGEVPVQDDFRLVFGITYTY